VNNRLKGFFDDDNEFEEFSKTGKSYKNNMDLSSFLDIKDPEDIAFEEFLRGLAQEAKENPPIVTPNYERLQIAFDVYAQLKELLDLYEAEYTIKIEKRPRIMPRNISIKIITDGMGAIIKDMPLLNTIMGKIDDISIYPSLDEKICILVGIHGVMANVNEENR